MRIQKCQFDDMTREGELKRKSCTFFKDNQDETLTDGNTALNATSDNISLTSES